ncbi:EAL domain-containing protein [Leucothrix sargassi]|nr:EAL domain-containing protein [Leucothrix sargassi]
MMLFDSLSLRSRFLVAPLIGVLLTLVIFYSSNTIIQNHTDILKQINQSNLPQVGDISRTVILFSRNHNKLENLLTAAEIMPDDKQIIVDGQSIINELNDLEMQLNASLGSTNQMIGSVDIFSQIKESFEAYREQSTTAIELATDQPLRAKNALHQATMVSEDLNQSFLVLSEYYVKNLTEQSERVEDSLYEESSLTLFSSLLLVTMIIAALYFSRRMSSEIEQINQSLISLSEGKKNIKLPSQSNKNMRQLTKAIYTFKQSLQQNEEQKSKLNRTIEELTDSKEKYLNLLNLIPTAIIVINNDRRIVIFNKAAEDIFGYYQQEIIGKRIDILLPDEYRSDMVARFEMFRESSATTLPAQEATSAITKSGHSFYVEANVAKLLLANQDMMTVAVTDITQRKAAEREITHKAHYDALTNLPNRSLAMQNLQTGLADAESSDESLAVFFLDLDGFKKINDTLGHETGDKLLIEAGKRLTNVVSGLDTVARLGGDEFIVILCGLTDSQDAIPTVDKVVQEFRKPFQIDGRELILTSSVGIAFYPADGDNDSELLRKADAAMYSAKARGRNTYTFFTESMSREVSRELALEEQLHGALKRDEFRLVYQLQVDIASGDVVGAEALMRWDNHLLGNVSPDEFIPIAEHTGLIIPLSHYVLTESLKQLSIWQKEYSEDFRLAINLSPRQFRDPNLLPSIEKALQDSKISAESIELEITEGVLMSGHSFIDEALTSLSQMGIRLAMDDFGTGYSSLSYLRRYSFDTLKIDRSFISDITSTSQSRELVDAIVLMAHSMGLEVVAEGVETQDQLDYLALRQCEFAQGYLFNVPVNAKEISALLYRHKKCKTAQQKEYKSQDDHRYIKAVD